MINIKFLVRDSGVDSGGSLRINPVPWSINFILIDIPSHHKNLTKPLGRDTLIMQFIQ